MFVINTPPLSMFVLSTTSYPRLVCLGRGILLLPLIFASPSLRKCVRFADGIECRCGGDGDEDEDEDGGRCGQCRGVENMENLSRGRFTTFTTPLGKPALAGEQVYHIDHITTNLVRAETHSGTGATFFLSL